MRPVVRGDRGKEVVDIQTRLRALGYFLGREGADGHFGANTERAIREFQQKRLLLMDGVVGENTWTELVEAGYAEGERLLYLRVPFMRGDDVLQLQRRLNELGFDSGPEDGIFGPVTENALTEFQRNVGAAASGNDTVSITHSQGGSTAFARTWTVVDNGNWAGGAVRVVTVTVTWGARSVVLRSLLS